MNRQFTTVHLGVMKVDSPLYYAEAVRMVYMMFPRSGGFPLRYTIMPTLADEIIRGLCGIPASITASITGGRSSLKHSHAPSPTKKDLLD